MKTYNIDEIADETYFSHDLYLDEKFIISISELAISKTLKDMLLKWNFKTVCSDGKIVDRLQPTVSNDSALSAMIQSTEKEQLSKAKKKKEELLSKVEHKYKEFLTTISKFHETAKHGINLNVAAVSDTAKDLCQFVSEKKKQILLIESCRFAEIFDYVIIHELRSTIFAVIIGNYLKLPNYKLIELASACLIHEIGMARIPARVYNSIEPLNLKEKQALLTHPIISYNIVNASSFALPICLACLEHHERENGSGYPRRLTANRISLYGKIIAVACSYEAVTSARPYRDARNPTASIMELVRNDNKQYDDTVLKALLYSVSFFPIGVYVVLSDGRPAQVVDVNPDDPRFPIVQLLGELAKNGSPKIFGTDKDSLYISRTVTRDEAMRLAENASDEIQQLNAAADVMM